MGKLLSFLKGSRIPAVMAPLAMGLEVYCDLQQPWLMATIINQGVMAGNLDVVFHTGLLMAGFAILGMVGGLGCNLLASIASHGFAFRLREGLFSRIQDLSLEQLEAFGSATLITRLGNDTGMLQQVLTMMLQVMVRAPLLFLGGIVMAVNLHAGLSTVLLAAIPAMGVFLVLVIKAGFARFARVQEALDRTSALIQENLKGIRVIKSFVRGPHQKQVFGKANRTLVDATIRANSLMTFLTPVLTLAMTLSIAVILQAGGTLVVAGTLEIGKLMSLVAYISQILGSLMMLSMMLTVISRARTSLDRVQEVLAEPAAVNGGQGAAADNAGPAGAPPGSTPPVRAAAIPADQGPAGMRLELRDVTFRHPLSTGEPALAGISLTVEPGWRLAVMGATGSGKTSLANLLARLHEPTSGSILMDGAVLADMDAHRVREQVGMATQKSLLFSGTLRENLLRGRPDATETELQSALSTAQAADFVQARAEGLDALLGQGGSGLSGGQRQRICIARALVRRPRLLILDDATSALDMATEARLLKALEEWKGSCTVVQVSQRIASVRNADRILVLEDGRMAGFGTHAQLLETCGVYREIADSQKEGSLHE